MSYGLVTILLLKKHITGIFTISFYVVKQVKTVLNLKINFILKIDPKTCTMENQEENPQNLGNPDKNSQLNVIKC